MRLKEETCSIRQSMKQNKIMSIMWSVLLSLPIITFFCLVFYVLRVITNKSSYFMGDTAIYISVLSISFTVTTITTQLLSVLSDKKDHIYWETYIDKFLKRSPFTNFYTLSTICFSAVFISFIASLFKWECVLLGAFATCVFSIIIITYKFLDVHFNRDACKKRVEADFWELLRKESEKTGSEKTESETRTIINEKIERFENNLLNAMKNGNDGERDEDLLFSLEYIFKKIENDCETETGEAEAGEAETDKEKKDKKEKDKKEKYIEHSIDKKNYIIKKLTYDKYRDIFIKMIRNVFRKAINYDYDMVLKAVYRIREEEKYNEDNLSLWMEYIRLISVDRIVNADIARKIIDQDYGFIIKETNAVLNKTIEEYKRLPKKESDDFYRSNKFDPEWYEEQPEYSAMIKCIHFFVGLFAMTGITRGIEHVILMLYMGFKGEKWDPMIGYHRSKYIEVYEAVRTRNKGLIPFYIKCMKDYTYIETYTEEMNRLQEEINSAGIIPEMRYQNERYINEENVMKLSQDESKVLFKYFFKEREELSELCKENMDDVVDFLNNMVLNSIDLYKRCIDQDKQEGKSIIFDYIKFLINEDKIKILLNRIDAYCNDCIELSEKIFDYENNYYPDDPESEEKNEKQNKENIIQLKELSEKTWFLVSILYDNIILPQIAVSDELIGKISKMYGKIGELIKKQKGE